MYICIYVCVYIMRSSLIDCTCPFHSSVGASTNHISLPLPLSVLATHSICIYLRDFCSIYLIVHLENRTFGFHFHKSCASLNIICFVSFFFFLAFVFLGFCFTGSCCLAIQFPFSAQGRICYALFHPAFVLSL